MGTVLLPNLFFIVTVLLLSCCVLLFPGAVSNRISPRIHWFVKAIDHILCKPAIYFKIHLYLNYLTIATTELPTLVYV